MTIKPANKSLGIVILNTDDYINVCKFYQTPKPTD